MKLPRKLLGTAVAAVLSAVLGVVVLVALPLPAGGNGDQEAFVVQAGEELTIGTWNLEWFFDDDKSDNSSQVAKQMSAPSADEYKWRVGVTAQAIAQMKPTVLALQEIENEKVVQDLADALKEKHQLEYSVGFKQGKDTALEQDVAFLFQKRPGTVTVNRVESTNLNFSNNNVFKVPSKHTALQVFRNTDAGKQSLTIITAHLKAGGGMSNETQRIKQSRVLNRWAGELMSQGNAVVVLGDFNAGKRFDATSAADAMGVLRGMESAPLTDDLVDLNGDLVPADRRTHVSGRELDRIVVSPNLLDDAGLVYKSVTNYRHLVVKGTPDDDASKTIWQYPKDERDLSDHYPLVAKFTYVP